MKKSNKNSIITATAVSFILILGVVGPVVAHAAGPAPVNLLSADNFVILSQTGITDTGSHSSAVTGNIGSSPITAAAMNDIFCSEITGTIYGVDAAYVGSGATTCFAGNPPSANKTLVDNAVSDMNTAYIDAAGRTNPVATELGAGNIGGMTLAPGLYKWSTGVDIPTNLTLSGGPNDVWIFQIAGNLTIPSADTIASGVHIVLAGGAQASNVFWQVGGATGATLGTYSTFNGTILSAKQVIIQTGAVLNGRALAQTQVTLEANAVTIPSAIAISTSTTTSTIPSADISINKLADVTSTMEGGLVHYTIVATDNGPATSTDVVATDTLPSGLKFENATTSVGSYASSTGTWTMGDMSASSTATLNIAALVNTGTASSTITNTATIKESSTETDPNLANNRSSVSIVVVGGGVSATSTLTVLVSGLNATDTAQIIVTDITASTTQSTSTNNLSSLFVFTTNDHYAVTASTTLPNYSLATSTGCVGMLVGNTACDVMFTLATSTTTSTTSSTDADIAIMKTVDNTNPSVGTTVNYILTVSDNGPATSTIVAVHDILPAGLTLVNAMASVGTYDASTGSWVIGTLSPNAPATLAIAAVVDNNESGLTITNAATVSELSSLVDPNLANNSSSVSLNVQASACASNCGGGGSGGTVGVGSGGGGSAYSISIDNGAGSTANVNATLALYGTEAYTMELSSSSDFSSSTWIPYATVLPWALAPGDGERTVYVNYRNVQGAVIGSANASIDLIRGGSSSVPSAGDTVGQVLGASTSCGFYLDSYIRSGWNNDPNEVKKLEAFLNGNLGINLPVAGIYDQQDFNAVEQFQIKYGSQILAPWIPFGLPNQTTPTGFVYQTTQWWINNLACESLHIPMPSLRVY